MNVLVACKGVFGCNVVPQSLSVEVVPLPRRDRLQRYAQNKNCVYIILSSCQIKESS